MFGTMEGILAPLADSFKVLARNKTKLTGRTPPPSRADPGCGPVSG